MDDTNLQEELRRDLAALQPVIDWLQSQTDEPQDQGTPEFVQTSSADFRSAIPSLPQDNLPPMIPAPPIPLQGLWIRHDRDWIVSSSRTAGAHLDTRGGIPQMYHPSSQPDTTATAVNGGNGDNQISSTGVAIQVAGSNMRPKLRKKCYPCYINRRSCDLQQRLAQGFHCCSRCESTAKHRILYQESFCSMNPDVSDANGFAQYRAQRRRGAPRAG